MESAVNHTCNAVFSVQWQQSTSRHFCLQQGESCLPVQYSFAGNVLFASRLAKIWNFTAQYKPVAVFVFVWEIRSDSMHAWCCPWSLSLFIDVLWSSGMMVNPKSLTFGWLSEWNGISFCFLLLLDNGNLPRFFSVFSGFSTTPERPLKHTSLRNRWYIDSVSRMTGMWSVWVFYACR